MRTIQTLILFALLIAPVSSFAGSVSGYYRSNGTYVQPYHRSAPDSTVTNNYSFKGNTNPYTGSVGSNRAVHDTTSPYFNGTPDNSGHVGHSGYSNFGYGRR